MAESMKWSFSLARCVSLSLMFFLLALQLEEQRVLVSATCREDFIYTNTRFCYMFPSKKRHLTPATMMEDQSSFGQILGGNPAEGPPVPATESPFLASFTGEGQFQQQQPEPGSPFQQQPDGFPVPDPQPPFPLGVSEENPFPPNPYMPPPPPVQPDAPPSPDDQGQQTWFGNDPRSGRVKRHYSDAKRIRDEKYEAIASEIMKKCCSIGSTCFVAELARVSQNNYETVCPG